MICAKTLTLDAPVAAQACITVATVAVAIVGVRIAFHVMRVIFVITDIAGG